MDVKKLSFRVELNDKNILSDCDDQDINKDNDNFNNMCYVNKGFIDSNNSKEELSNGVEEEFNNFSINELYSKASTLTDDDGYVNKAFDDNFQKPDKGTVPLARDTTVITSSTLENQITKLDEDNNGLVAVSLETEEKKRKIQLVGWDSNRSIILFGLILAFDAWVAAFYFFKTSLIK